MKLYDVARNTMIRVAEQTSTPPGGIPGEDGEVYRFLHIDGMYSYCVNDKNQVVHLAAWTEVEIVE